MRLLRLTRSLFLVVAMSVTLVAQQRDAAVTVTGTSEITGVVLGVDGQPVRRTIVTISADALPSPRSVITDDGGRFAFRRLPAGSFAVSAKKAAYLPTEHGASHPGRPGSRVVLAANEKRAVMLKIFRGGVISGSLSLASGAPASGVSVVALNIIKAGQRERSSEPTITNDKGEYRIYGLMPGEYLIAATPSAAGSGNIGVRSTAEMDAVLARLAARQNPAAPATKPAADSDDIPPAPVVVGYAPIYFPGTPVLAESQPIRVAAEEDRAGTSFLVSRVPVAAIKGTISGDVANLASVQISIIPELRELRFTGNQSVGMTAMPPNAAGEFEFGSLSPGRYSLVARGRDSSNEPVYASADVEIRGQDVTGLGLALRPGGKVSGIIVFDSGGAMIPADPSRFRVGLTMVGENSWYQLGGVRIGNILSDVPQVPVNDDSEFRITGIGPASYTLTCTIPPDLMSTWRVRAAFADGRDLLDEIIVGPDVNLRQVQIILSDKRTELSGTLTSAAGVPMSDYYVIAFSADRAHWRVGSRRSQSARPATNGRFVFNDLPAGEYLIAAVTDLDPDRWQESAFLEQVAPAAIKIRLAEGEKKVQDIRLR